MIKMLWSLHLRVCIAQQMLYPLSVMKNFEASHYVGMKNFVLRNTPSVFSDWHNCKETEREQIK
jgi:hypothetical protein